MLNPDVLLQIQNWVSNGFECEARDGRVIHGWRASYGTRILTLPLKIESEVEVEVSPSIGGKNDKLRKECKRDLWS